MIGAEAQTAFAGRDPSRGDATTALRRATQFWFGATVMGQLLFVLFIVVFYYPSTFSGDFAGWNGKPLIKGFQPGDGPGNLMFAAHVVTAALFTAAGIAQLLPAVRSKWPGVHRWMGRAYLTMALLLASGGLWLTWSRGTYMNVTGALGITLDAMLIFTCAGMALWHARRRRFALHRRWALRTFIVASAVWFMRVGYMAWGIASGGAGIGNAMNGPFDLFIAFANSLLPLAILEIYLRVSDRGNRRQRYMMAGLLAICGVITLGGSLGAWFIMWSPYL